MLLLPEMLRTLCPPEASGGVHIRIRRQCLVFSPCMFRSGGGVCRNLLRTAIRRGGELDTAPRKAEVLNRICEQLRFDSDVAALLHRWATTSFIWQQPHVQDEPVSACTEDPSLLRRHDQAQAGICTAMVSCICEVLETLCGLMLGM